MQIELVEVQKMITSDTGWVMDSSSRPDRGLRYFVRLVSFATTLNSDEFTIFSKWLKSNKKIESLATAPGITNDKYDEAKKHYRFFYTVDSSG